MKLLTCIFELVKACLVTKICLLFTFLFTEQSTRYVSLCYVFSFLLFGIYYVWKGETAETFVKHKMLTNFTPLTHSIQSFRTVSL